MSHFGDVTLWRCPKKSTGVQFKKVVFETFYGWIYNPYTYHRQNRSLSLHSYLRVREGGVTKRVNARDENENNNTGFGVIRIQVASKSARAPLAGSDRYRYQCVHTAVPVPVL